MSASKFTRNKDYSDEEASGTGGRSSVDTAGLDGEMDEIRTVTDDHADKLDLVLRDDLKVKDDLLEGHEFSPQALTFLASQIGSNSALVWRSSWANNTLYVVGNLVLSGGNVYICLSSHTSHASDPFAVGTSWELFFSPAAFALPSQTGNAGKALVTDGTVASWGTLITTLATLLDPTFAGVVGLPDVNFAGRFNMSVEVVAFAAGGNTFNFDTKFLKTVAVTGNYTGANTASNITQGDLLEVHFHNTSGSAAALLWAASWSWMGYKPSSLPAGKKAVLSLRAPTGSTAADIVALWSVQP